MKFGRRFVPERPTYENMSENKWDFMIVLQDKSLPSVWEEYYGLSKLQSNHTKNMIWGDREQKFEWVNEIEYYYGQNQKEKIVLHVATYRENWQEVDKSSGEIINKT